ncbi:MAG TPA: aminodeoxychorismate/anthranilate synthase component II [Acidimicrobiales bacterium]|jgi:anthranilate synthase/aminodeoxychorismate synthase-like glutamine amidotransferase|nr:aminodeoxychorismate/anthranilate synthase component II [Acidimicrobiales bacterium]
MRRVVVVDNYDSFVYNLVQYLGELGADPVVYRPDEISVEAIEDLRPDAVVISPGPGRPEDAKLSNAVIERLAGPRDVPGTVPILGVCLGHQCIGHVFGADVVRAPTVVHGKTSLISHGNQGVMAGLRDPFEATRYHSLLVDRASLPEVLEVTAETADGLVMGLRHRDLAVEGVQFHPESILTEDGRMLLANFLGSAAAA